MKKLISMLLAMMLAMMTLAVFAEAPAEEAAGEEGELMTYADLSGYVMDVQDGLLLIKTADGLYVEAHLTDDTTMSGQEAAIGDFVHVIYNGMMTRSLPAQITAQHVICHSLTGIVSNVTGDGFTLTTDADEYIVHADAAWLGSLAEGMTVTVYFSGAVTMSLPAQLTAEHIRGQMITGVVTEMVENGFTLTVEGEELPYEVGVKADALLFVQPEPGLTVSVVTDGLMTSGLESILINAAEVLPVPYVQELYEISGVVTEITEEYFLITTPDGQTIQVNRFAETLQEGKEIAAGDFVFVTYNGQMTFSLPAQIAALKVGCYAFTGVISDLSDAQFVLNTELEPIVVNLAEGQAEGLADGMTVTVYTNGAMTMSLPAQVGAAHITATETIMD